MNDEGYHKLAEVLDNLPSGFPKTESGVEIRILKKIFRPEEAELFCDLKLSFETVEQIAGRTGRPVEGLEDMLNTMWERGQIMGVDFGGTRLFRMIPWVIGIYEFQLPHMDKELAEMCDEYMDVHGKQFFKNKPQIMQVVPVEKEIQANHEALSYEKVSSLIENSRSFMVMDCICKKEQGLLDNRCEKPLEVCMAIAPVPGIFDNNILGGRVISKEEANKVLSMAEDAGLVHLTWNTETGHWFICNCCGCCCGVLRGINKMGIPASMVVNSHYYAEIDPDLCEACGICKEERCQVNAIEEDDNAYRVIRERCIGCGLCVTTCPSGALELFRKQPENLVPPPKDEMAWNEERGQQRGVDFSAYK